MGAQESSRTHSKFTCAIRVGGCCKIWKFYIPKESDKQVELQITHGQTTDAYLHCRKFSFSSSPNFSHFHHFPLFCIVCMARSSYYYFTIYTGLKFAHLTWISGAEQWFLHYGIRAPTHLPLPTAFPTPKPTNHHPPFSRFVAMIGCRRFPALFYHINTLP